MVLELLFVVVVLVVLEVVFVLLAAPALGSICGTAAVADSVDALAGAEDMLAAVVLPPPVRIGDEESFFFLRGGRPPASASLSLESLELESLELDDEESLELLLEDILPPEGATSCLLASSFFAFFFPVPS